MTETLFFISICHVKSVQSKTTSSQKVFDYDYSVPEDGSSGGNLVPALDHEGVHPRGTVLGTRQQLTRPDHLYHLCHGHGYCCEFIFLGGEEIDFSENGSEYSNPKY